MSAVHHARGNQFGGHLICNERSAFDEFQHSLRLVEHDKVPDAGGGFRNYGIHTVVKQHAVVLDVGFRREGSKPRSVRFVGGLIRIFVYL